jgi:hypothetical protein
VSDRSRTTNLKVKASKWEDADFTAGHSSYRKHLENLRKLLVGVEYTIKRDADEAARWMRQHSKPRGNLIPSVCWRMSWLDAWTLSLRYRFKGKLVAELVDEAAQAAVLMAQIHAEYVQMERNGVPESGRYRRSGS